MDQQEQANDCSGVLNSSTEITAGIIFCYKFWGLLPIHAGFISSLLLSWQHSEYMQASFLPFSFLGNTANTRRLHFFPPFSFLGNTAKTLQIHILVQDDACQMFLTFAFHYILCKTDVYILCKTDVYILCKTDVYTGGKKQATTLILSSSPYQEIFQVILSYRDLCHGHKLQ